MADDNEDDLFADLYENDEPSQPVAPQESKNAPSQPEPEPPAENAIASIDTAMNDEAVESSGAMGSGLDHGQEIQSSGWMGDNGGETIMAGGAVPQEDSKIGIKEDGKMFVGGLNWETTDESLKNYFSQFGEVAECTVMRDANTGRSRGFGFLTFKDPKDVNMVMVKEHFLDGKIERTSKIFVGGVSQEATEEDFKNYFSQYGRVIDATLMMDKDTGRPRGFGFVTFDSEQAVEATLAGDLTILGKPIEVKKAQPRGNMKEEEHSGRGGRRGGRGHDGNNFDQGGGGGMMSGGMGGMQGANGQMNGMQGGSGGNVMTPQMMAMFWQQMRTMMALTSGNMGMANPMMMQQMMMAQQMRNQQGGQSPIPPNMQQMMMQQQQQAQNQQQNGMNNNSNGPPGSAGGGGGGNSPMPGVPTGPSAGRSGTPGSQQQMFGAGGNQNGQWGGEGMYEDGSMQQQGGGTGQNFGGPRGRGGHFAKGRQPPTGPSNAPANAPTGPKNAGIPGANYRGGRGGGGRGGGGGFHPYRR